MSYALFYNSTKKFANWERKTLQVKLIRILIASKILWKII